MWHSNKSCSLEYFVFHFERLKWRAVNPCHQTHPR